MSAYEQATRPCRGMAARRALAALAVVAAAVGMLVVAGSPGWLAAVLDPISPRPAAQASGLEQLLTVVAGLSMVGVGWGLWRGKRRALGLLVAALLAVAAWRALHGAGNLEIAAELLAAAVMAANRRAFACGGARRAALRPAALLVGAAGGAYVLGAVLLSHGFAHLGVALGRTVSWLAAGGWWLRADTASAIALDVLTVMGIVALVWLVRSLLAPAPAIEGHSAAEHARAAAIVAEHGHDSLDPFALREDKSFHFAHGGFVAYRTLHETAVVSGDPVGPPGTHAAILASFEREATRRGWELVLTAASESRLDGYRQLGFRVMRIGSEAVVDPRRFSLEGRSIRKVRQSVTRLRRRGWTVETVPAAELTASQIRGISEVERAWRAAQPRLYGFAMTLGRLWGAEEDSTGLYVIARDDRGALRCFLRFASYRDGLSLDAMRRAGECPNGVNEALVVAALEHARGRGIAAVSLNFAGFAHVMASDADLGIAHRLLRLLLTRVHGRFQLERLVRFNEKFGPQWRPRHLVYRSGPGLPLGALRVLQAEAYVPPPRRRVRAPDAWRPLLAPVPAPELSLPA